MSRSTDQIVYDHAIDALAQNRLPDYSTFDASVVAKAFANGFDGFSPKPDWLDELKTGVLRRSGFRVRLEEADISEFRERVKGPAAYLALIHGADRSRLRLVPGVKTPFTIDE